MDLKELKALILADGAIDAEEVTKISDIIFADGKIDQEEMDFLFDLNESAKTKCPEFTSLVVKAGTSFCLNDEKTPGVVDAAEASYLIKAIMSDGQVDDVERALLAGIKANAVSMDAALVSKMVELGI